jgi:hypothetical protein
MAYPTAYSRQYNFQNFQTLAPTTPLPAAQVDGELNAVKLSLDQTQTNLALIQRSDGELANGSVGADQIADSLSVGFTLLGAWAEDYDYITNDGVTYGNKFYKAASAHTSEAATRPDLDDSVWTELFDVSTLAVADGSITTVKIDDGAVTNAKLDDMSAGTIKGRADGAGTGAPTDLTGAQVRTILGSASDTTTGVVELATSAEVVTGTDTARAVTPAGVAAVAGWRLLASKTASSSATIDFTASDFDFSAGTYDEYMVEFSQVKPATDDVYLFLRIGTGAGPTYQVAGYQWASRAQGISSGVDHGSTTDSQTTAIVMTRMTTATTMVGNDTGEHVSGTVEFANPEATDQPIFSFRTRYLSAATGALWGVTGAGRYASNGAITAIRFVFLSGNIASGTFRLYGLKK